MNLFQDIFYLLLNNLSLNSNILMNESISGHRLEQPSHGLLPPLFTLSRIPLRPAASGCKLILNHFLLPKFFQNSFLKLIIRNDLKRCDKENLIFTLI
jgi:hypothetical protein